VRPKRAAPRFVTSLRDFSSQPLTTKTKKPPDGGFFVVVEVVGIEPTSASPPLRGLHAYSVFNLIAGYPTGRENSQPAPKRF